MGVQNISRQEANEKIKELAKKADVCLFTTNLTELPLTARPMSTRDVDENGCIWFFSREGSNKNREIEADNRVQLFYSNFSSSEYMSLYGKVTIVKDDLKAKELWSDIAKTWFNEGYDDPELTLLKVEPEEGHYWDTKDGRVISLVKMVAGAITGKELEVGVEGTIRK
ncbi:MAG: pyridoxamine 5'-phosphate oxidase family protein [Chitinophagaceae bacterium]